MTPDQRRQAAIEAGGRALYEDTWLPELWPAWEALNEKRREEYRHRFAVCLDAAAPHLAPREPLGYTVIDAEDRLKTRRPFFEWEARDRLRYLRENEHADAPYRLIALTPVDES